MPHEIDVAQYDLPLAALIDALASDDASIARSRLVARLRRQQAKARAAFKKQSENLAKLYEEIEHGDYDPGYLMQMAEVVFEKERAATERLRPGAETLQAKLTNQGHELDPEVGEYFRESLDIAARWLELYRSFRSRLLALSSERKSGSARLLRARPVAGDIDYAALTREFIARFPKILAALAK